MAFVALCYAWSGLGWWPLSESYLHLTLTKNSYNLWWAGLVGVPAAMLLYLSGREWAAQFLKRRWDLLEIEHSATRRSWMCLVLAWSWGYIVYVLLHLGGRPNALLLIALGSVVFSLWFFAENRRVKREFKEQATIFPRSTA